MVEIFVIPDWPNFLLQLINTAIMFAIVCKFAWKPMKAMKEKRQQIALAGITEANDKKAAADKMLKEADAYIGKSRTEGREIIETSKSMAESLRKKILSDAHEKADRAMKQAEEEIRLSEKKAVAVLKQDAAKLAVESASRLIRREIDPSLHKELFKDFLVKVGEEFE
ncbi:MAG: F0F1 ATP synthase subunit B [Turicibacter sp.]|nr:F0F1 ATP synthase subunit B [Turicibacter sp.]